MTRLNLARRRAARCCPPWFLAGRFGLLALVIGAFVWSSARSVDLSQAQGDGLSRTLAFEAVDLAGGEELMLARATAIDLTRLPVIPTLSPAMQPVIARGQHLGRDPHHLSKVGDCNSTHWLFLYPFDEDQYDLGPYAALQSTIDYFAGTFAVRSVAAHNGLNVAAVHDPLWSPPTLCEEGESPLQCEYRLRNPAVALIMFGTNDTLVLTPAQFDQNLRRLVVDTLDAGIVPVLSTFPRHLSFPDRSVLFNQIVARAALDFNVPLINFWLALEPLPQHGVADDGFHLNGPLTRAADFTSERNLTTGHPLRNLLTLQTLDRLRPALQGG